MLTSVSLKLLLSTSSEYVGEVQKLSSSFSIISENATLFLIESLCQGNAKIERRTQPSCIDFRNFARVRGIEDRGVPRDFTGNQGDLCHARLPGITRSGFRTSLGTSGSLICRGMPCRPGTA